MDANNLVARKTMPAMSSEAIDKVKALRDVSLTMPQVDNNIEDGVHGRMYYRTGRYPAGAVMTSVFVRVPTLLIIRGDVKIYVGDNFDTHIKGYQVVEGYANRQPAFHFLEDTDMTMVFVTNAKTTAEAEEEITPEAHMLQSRKTS